MTNIENENIQLRQALKYLKEYAYKNNVHRHIKRKDFLEGLLNSNTADEFQKAEFNTLNNLLSGTDVKWAYNYD